MPRSLLLILSFALVSQSFQSLAQHGDHDHHHHDHDGHDHHHHSHWPIDVLNDDSRQGLFFRMFRAITHKAAPEVQQALHMAHEALDNGNPNAKGWKGFFRSWLDAVNAKQIILNGHRFYQVDGRHGPLKELIPDILALNLMTHGVEVSFVVWGNMIAALFHASPEVHATITTVGIIISTPGTFIGQPWLEPVCILGTGGYLFSKTFRKVVRQISRYGVQPALSALSWGIDWVSTTTPRDQFISETLAGHHNLPVEPNIETAADGDWMVDLGEPMQLRFSQRNGEWQLTEFTLGESSQELTEIIESQLLTMFSSHSQNIIAQSQKYRQEDRLDQWQHKFFVEGVRNEDGKLKVNLKPGAALLKPVKHLRWAKPKFVTPRECWQAFARLPGV